MSIATAPLVPTIPWGPAPVGPPRFVVLPHDTVTARRLRSITGDGVVMMKRYATDLLTIEAAAASVMSGLGKNPLLALSKRWTTPIASGWLAANEIRRAVIVDAAEYPLDVRDEIIEWLTGHGVQVFLAWMTTTGIAPAPPVVADGAVELGVDEFWAAFPDAIDTAEPVETCPSLPTVPRVDGVVFRSTCRDLLSPEEFAVVDERFRAVVALVDQKVKASRQLRSSIPPGIVRPLLDTAPDTEELLLRTRAAQVALLRHGYHMTVNVSALLGAAECQARRGFVVPQRWWERLNAYWDPDTPAAVALRFVEIDHDELPAIRLGDVEMKAADHVLVTVERDGAPEQFELEGPPARYVTALYVLRLAAAAGPTDRLFATHRAREITRQFARDRLTGDPSFDTGIDVPGRLDQSAHRPWLRRYGITIQVLNRDMGDDGDV